MVDHNGQAPREMASATPKTRLSLGRTVPLVILMAGLISFFAFGLHNYLSFEILRENTETLSLWVERSYVLAASAYILIYVIVVAFSLPGGAVMSITGGFLFGWIAGIFYILIGATIGATVLFLAAKTALGDALRDRTKGAIRKLEDGFRENAFNYLLFLRLVPALPFWLVNLVPAFLGVGLRTYVSATFIGIIPGAAVYSSVGSGLGAALDEGGTPDLGLIFNPQILIPIIALAALALVPVLYQKYVKAKSMEQD